MIIINPDTRQFNVPGAELVFGVESDAGSERKYFQCPRYVGDNLDLASCFVRMNFRNANGAMDSYLVDDVTVDGDNVTFSWVLSEKAVKYKGHVKFVVCVVGPNQKVEWHTTLGTGMVLEGLEPEINVEAGTADVVAQLIAMVEVQTAAVEAEGDKQIKAVQAAAKTAETAFVAEIEAKGVNTRESIPEDYTALSEAVDGLVRSRAGAIVCEAAGSAVAVSDASDNYIQGLRIFGRSTQDGTPTPTSPVEIKSVEKPVVTVAGKNLIKNVGVTNTYEGITFTVNADKSITVNGTSTGVAPFVFCRDFLFKAGVRYKLTGCPIGGGSDTYRMDNVDKLADDGDGGYVKYDVDTTASVRIRIAAGVTVNNLTFYPMLRFASIDDDTYEPYSGQTLSTTRSLPGIPVTSGGNYTDSDGQQWICDEVDLGRGVYVRRVKQLTLDGSEAWKTSSGKYIYMRIDEKAPKSSRGFCSCVPYKYSYEGDGIFAIENTVYLGAELSQRFNMDVTTWTNILTESPATLLYNLASPVETPLSETEIAAYRALHSNYPNTTVLNDAGAHMVVKYATDTKLYIDNKIKEALQ